MISRLFGRLFLFLQKKMRYFLVVILLILGYCENTKNKIQNPQNNSLQENFVCDTATFSVYNYFDSSRIARFQYEINKFSVEDSLNKIDYAKILFTGSSSIRKWDNVSSYFNNEKILNRGFGGSTFAELIYYAEDVIFKYNPQIILIYEGDNDQYILNPYQILKCACYLEKLIHSRLPETKILFLSVKPSPARRNKIRTMHETNILLKNFADTTKNTLYINVWDSMFDKNGKIIPDIFKKDSLHLNEAGYRIWAKIIQPYLQ